MKVDESEAYMYDPAVFYGHHEYDLAISSMFPGFRQQFYDAYHALIPKAPGFEDRQRVYQLFHYLNHWNHFGGGYKSSSLSIMRNLASMLKKRLIEALVLPLFNYCDVVYSPNLKVELQQYLQRAQNACVSYICNLQTF
uniref:protein-ribulosamine 3-kinase n=1 Tax=Cacopsylla melanoneura TaxID=428564 RepID=A0A8D8PPN0_9HEMI